MCIKTIRPNLDLAYRELVFPLMIHFSELLMCICCPEEAPANFWATSFARFLNAHFAMIAAYFCHVTIMAKLHRIWCVIKNNATQTIVCFAKIWNYRQNRGDSAHNYKSLIVKGALHSCGASTISQGFQGMFTLFLNLFVKSIFCINCDNCNILNYLEPRFWIVLKKYTSIDSSTKTSPHLW